MSNISVEARAFPISNPQGSTLSFANLTLKVDGEDLLAIRGARVIDGEKGLFVSMPQSQGKNKEFHDVAFPLTADLRKEMNRAVLGAYEAERDNKKQSIGNKIQKGKEKASQHTYGDKNPAQQKAANRDAR
jgi:stage V sporulation protein G